MKMLDELHVQNVALIGDAVFSPAPGLTVLTGETGAGKTALISALKLIMGERADASAVRQGCDAALVEGRFFGSAAGGSDAPQDDGSEEGIVAVRRLGADGRSRCQLNGAMAANRELAREIGSRIDLCGQHEHQRLMKTAGHIDLLDAWASETVAGPAAAYAAAFDAAAAAAAELERVTEASRASSAALDEARFTLARIDELSPFDGEYEELMARLPRIENAEALAQAANTAYACLAGEGGEGAMSLVNAAASALDSVSRIDDGLAAAAQALRESAFVLEDVARDMRSYRDEVEFDPSELASMQERASALQGLMRAFGPSMADVLRRREEAAEMVRLVDHSQAAIAAARKVLDAAEADLAEAARALDGARRSAAPRFEEAVATEMGRLEMGSASIVCGFSELPRERWTRTQSASMEFMYRAGAGMQPRPLARIASGGEISRVMLACKVVLGEHDSADTLVFDEVDAGVGGATAVALADVLADLAATHQVIVVTHLPQVAVRAQSHYLVSKTYGELPETCLRPIDGEERVAEIARMLSGSATDAALAHAREMLA